MDTERLIDLIGKFRGRKIGVVGDVLLDSYLFGRVNRVNHERPGYPLLTIEREEHRLGGAGNVAANLISMEAQVVLFGAIGNDNHGSVLKKRCKRRRIKFFHVIEGKTILKQRRIESVHKDYLGREDFGEAKLEKLTLNGEKKLFNAILEERPEVLILSDYNKKVFRGDFAKRLITWANKEGILTIVDPKPVNIESFRGASIISPNLRESEEILGRKVKDEDLESVAKMLREFTGSKNVVMTCGEEGIASYDGSFYRTPTEVKELTDVTGAGDTVIAVLGLAMASGASLSEATCIANHAAGIVVEKLGTASVTRRQLVEQILGAKEE